MSKKFPIEPLGSLLFVERIPDHSGAIALLDPNDRQQKSCRGKVVASGPGAPLPDGSVVPQDVQVGDVVFFGALTGIEANFAGRAVLVMHNADVIAVGS